MALAAFFEEVGQVAGLLDAISEATEWDEQLSEGKALSDREEAVLQSLEIMTRNADGAVWLKASELRERVREMMDISASSIRSLTHFLVGVHQSIDKLIGTNDTRIPYDGYCHE